jgi:3-deoxy-D-manno-octulosonic-acid transferase
MTVKPSALGSAAKAVYRAVAWAGHRLAPERLNRRAALARWRAWASSRRPGPLVWVHAASVGEALTALPVCRRLRSAAAELVIALTYTSPSAERWPGGWPVDGAGYFPPDLPGPMQAMLDALRPRLLVYSRTDVWPELTAQAITRDVPVAILGGTVGPRSGRLGWPVRSLCHPLYASMAYVGAASTSDAERLARLGVIRTLLDVTGDPRHDQVLDRVPDGKTLRRMADWAGSGDVLVAGSTEPTDEPLLLEAFGRVSRRRPHARLLICPHDPSPARCHRLAVEARYRGLEAQVWRDEPPPASSRCLIVERTGVLADLYALAALAYVGGGMGPHGLHAVMEPASFAVPVILGPRGHGADAAMLLRARGALVLPQREAATALAGAWETWLADGPARARTGLAARGALSGGAAQRTATRLLDLLASANGEHGRRQASPGSPAY